MKPRHIVEIAALVCICWSLASCATSKAPDGTVTQTLDPVTADLAKAVGYAALSEYQRQNPPPVPKNLNVGYTEDGTPIHVDK